MKHIYLDNAAATPIAPRVLKAMAESNRKYGNPSSFNDAGRLARNEIEAARKVVARFLNAKPEEIIFTSSGSEANNLALQGALANGQKGIVLTTEIEHPSVRESLKQLKNITVKYIPINKEGIIEMSAFAKLLSANCRLVSVMYANNEIGSIEPIRQISCLIKEYNSKTNKAGSVILFHVDACQAAGYLDMDVHRLGVDFLTFNGSKIYGPRGMGILYVRRGIKLKPIIFGGSQEWGLRAGTENTSAIIGLAKAIALINRKEAQKISNLRDYAIKKLEEKIPGLILNGPRSQDRLANNINICLPGLESETLLLELDKYGIFAGSGSACTSHAVEPSHVLQAIGVPATHINGALRFSLGKETTKEEIDYLGDFLSKITKTLYKRFKTTYLKSKISKD